MRLPEGSILVSETWPAVTDAQANAVRDSNGRLMKMDDI
jgi:hypothetical protein